MKLNLPHLSYQHIGEIADQFLSKYHPKLSLPIPIEEIAENKLNLKIYEEFNLKKDYDVESFLTSDLSTIFIDFDIYAKVENRAKSSIAHEIGHLILHGNFLSKQNITSSKDLDSFINKIDEDDYSWLEYQAYSFANQVLVPKKSLFEQLKNKLGHLQKDVRAESIMPSVGQDLLDVFKVSEYVMMIRLEKEGIVRSTRK